MKTKRFFLFGLLAVLLATGLVLTGCGGDDGDGDGDGDGGGGDDSKGVDATISLAATNNANEFTLTLTGATWYANAGGSIGLASESSALNWSTINLGANLVNWSGVRTSDTVMTYTLTKKSDNGTATVTLKDNDYWAEMTGSGSFGGTRGARFLRDYTNEGETDAQYNSIGTLTNATPNATVIITIE
jgi:hypothetical protein